ncbi:MAG: M23 family metallopeptidase [Clostridiales bacterium]|nr:M23 family metallopeptidase [Clostridiales bacterium]
MESSNNSETEDAADGDATENNTKNNSTTESEAADDTTGETYAYNGKDKLIWPLVGNIILPYSMDTTIYYTTLDQYACNDGILISAKKGSQVKAVADGRIVNIYESDKYGCTVTLLIGTYYEVYYSQVENLQYEIGDEVEAGDVIATVAEPTRSFTLEGPHLFFQDDL